MTWKTIAPQSGVAFELKKDSTLIVKDPRGEQVADLFCFSQLNHEEYLSSGRSMDYASKLFLTEGDSLYSNQSNKMLTITADDVRCHDFLFTPCSKDSFRICYGEMDAHNGCYENLANALETYGIKSSSISTTFNIFMNVEISLPDGQLTVLPPKSKQGDKIHFKSHMDLIIGLTACSAKKSNNYTFKPIEYKIV